MIKFPDLLAFGAGLVFGVGLLLGGMTDPAKVLAFLDVTGEWDPSLAFVMGGAILAYAPLRAWIVRTRPQPPPSSIDAKLVLGAALFGAGWGLVGYCPGPAVVALPALNDGTLTVVAGMLAGMVAFSVWSPRR